MNGGHPSLSHGGSSLRGLSTLTQEVTSSPAEMRSLSHPGTQQGWQGETQDHVALSNGPLHHGLLS